MTMIIVEINEGTKDNTGNHHRKEMQRHLMAQDEKKWQRKFSVDNLRDVMKISTPYLTYLKKMSFKKTISRQPNLVLY